MNKDKNSTRIRDSIRRIHIIEGYIDPLTADILEIGALDSPTFSRDRFQVKYADYASRSELSERSKSNPRYTFDRLVEVDYVVLEKKYSEVIDKKFDIIVANHVIEHIPDAIGWLHDLGKILSPYGILFLSVPDRRFTFDIARRESNFLDLLRPHITGQAKPDFLNLLDHFWHHKPVKVSDVLQNRHHDLMKVMRFSPEDAIVNALRLSERPYADVHCHVFTDSSFETTFTQLREFGYFAYKQMITYPVERGMNEFNVVLRQFDETLYKSRQIRLS